MSIKSFGLKQHIPIVLVGNKSDVTNRVISTDQARMWISSQPWNILYIETSAKEGTNVKEAFHMCAEKVGEQVSPRKSTATVDVNKPPTKKSSKCTLL